MQIGRIPDVFTPFLEIVHRLHFLLVQIMAKCSKIKFVMSEPSTQNLVGFRVGYYGLLPDASRVGRVFVPSQLETHSII